MSIPQPGPYQPQQFQPTLVPVAAPAPKIFLPVEDKAYHQFWRAPSTAVWRPLVAMVIVGVSWFVVTMLASIAAVVADPSAIGPGNTVTITPALFLSNNLSLAALIALAFIASGWLLKQPPGYMSSVLGRVRWRWLGFCMVVALPIWLAQLGVEFLLAGGDFGLSMKPHTVSMVIIVATTQVFQCAGEEYGFRGVLNRGVGSLIPHELAGFLVGGALSSVAFMFVHGAGDPWLNLFYFVFGMCAAWLTWRTGGLEAAIAVHCVNNLVSMSLLPFSSLDNIFDREAGAGSPWMLINMAVLVAATALLTWLAKRKGIVAKGAPGRTLTPPPPPVWTYGPYPPAQPPYPPAQPQGFPGAPPRD